MISCLNEIFVVLISVLISREAVKSMQVNVILFMEKLQGRLLEQGRLLG